VTAAPPVLRADGVPVPRSLPPERTEFGGATVDDGFRVVAPPVRVAPSGARRLGGGGGGRSGRESPPDRDELPPELEPELTDPPVDPLDPLLPEPDDELEPVVDGRGTA
jgi:hypothetical protein